MSLKRWGMNVVRVTIRVAIRVRVRVTLKIHHTYSATSTTRSIQYTKETNLFCFIFSTIHVL